MTDVNYHSLASQYGYPHLVALPNLGDLLQCAACTDLHGLAYYSGIADKDILVDLMILAQDAGWLGYYDGGKWIDVEL